MVRPVTRQPISRAANSAKPPQPQPISSTWSLGVRCRIPGQRAVFGALARFRDRWRRSRTAPTNRSWSGRASAGRRRCRDRNAPRCCAATPCGVLSLSQWRMRWTWVISQLAPPADPLARLDVDDEKLQETGDVGAFPVAVHVGFGHADRAGAEGAAGQVANSSAPTRRRGRAACPPTWKAALRRAYLERPLARCMAAESTALALAGSPFTSSAKLWGLSLSGPLWTESTRGSFIRYLSGKCPEPVFHAPRKNFKRLCPTLPEGKHI